MIITKGIQAKLYPNCSQRNWLTQQFGNIRFIWNYFLHYIQILYKANKKFPRKYDLYNMLKPLKKRDSWLKKSDSRSLQVEVGTLYQTYKRFFEHLCKHPKYKSKKYFKQSYTTSSVPNQPRAEHYLHLAKLGYVKAHLNMHQIGKIKQAAVILAPNGAYYVSLTVQCESQSLPKTHYAVGIDVGLDNLATLSNGRKFSFKYYAKSSEHYKHVWERKLARRRQQAYYNYRYDEHLQKQIPNHHVKPTNSYKNYLKAKHKVARISRHITNQRNDYLQKLTTWLVKHFDLIAIEDIKVSSINKNHHLARAVANASWRKFRIMLTYKCKWYGKILEVVNPQYTSQVCHTCGMQTGKKPLDVRSFTCPFCKTKQDRDVNAAINILRLGLEQAMDNNWTSAGTPLKLVKFCKPQRFQKPARSAESDARHFSAE